MAVNPEEMEIAQDVARRETSGVTYEAGAAIRQASLWRDAWRRFTHNKAAVISMVAFVILALYVIIVPFASPYDPNAVNFNIAYQTPGWSHPFGTDEFGRDLFIRTALGGRISIGIGFAGTFAIMVVGTVNFWTMVIALSVASWFITARVVRGQIITLKENDYVRAAHAVGVRWYMILGRHLLPNTLGVLVITIFLELPGVILGEAFLSFLGLGINPPDASWGSMAQDGRDAYRAHPHIIIIPSLAIATLVLCANFVADGLRDALDPRTKET